MKKQIAATKNFVSKHRVGIAVVVTSSVFVALQVHAASEWNEFLKDHNLLDEFYAVEESVPTA